MVQTVNESGGRALAAVQDERQRLGPAGWLGAVLVVAAATAFIVQAPRSTFDSSRTPKPPAARAVPPDSSSAVYAVSAAYSLVTLKTVSEHALAFEQVLKKEPDFLEAARLLGVQAQSVRVTPSTIRETRHPMILLLTEEPDVVATAGSLAGLRDRGGVRYVVLAEVRANDAVILDPVIGRIAVPVPDLAESVAGTGVVWRPAP